MVPAIKEKQPETNEQPIHYTCDEAIEYIKGLKIKDEVQPQQIEGAHIGDYSLFTQWDRYAIYRGYRGKETIEVIDIQKKKLIQTIQIKDQSSDEPEKFH